MRGTERTADRLDPVDHAFHQRVIQQYQAALAGMETWQAYLAHKYGLQGGDAVQPDGSIVRKRESDERS